MIHAALRAAQSLAQALHHNSEPPTPQSTRQLHTAALQGLYQLITYRVLLAGNASPSTPPNINHSAEALDTLDQAANALGGWHLVDAHTLGQIHQHMLAHHLEHTPQGPRFAQAPGAKRKTQGSYYTPPSLVERLLQTTLDPIIHRTTQSTDARQQLLQITVCDPSCGTGHFLLAAAQRLIDALTQDGHLTHAQAHQHVATHCLYGVDMDPFAVQLCQLALWRLARTPNTPLDTFNTRIKLGNALLGAPPNPPPRTAPWITALPGDDPTLARQQRTQLQRTTAQESLHISTTAQADAWCAAFLWPRHQQAPPPITAVTDLTPQQSQTVAAVAGEHHFFHWHLAFPQVFERGGFNAILANPPWERLKLQEKEFFATRAPHIANAPKAATRRALIAKLPQQNPALHRLLTQARRHADGQRHFVRQSGLYPLCAHGDLNAYALFAELYSRLIAPDGRIGAILPSGIATDRTTRFYFQDLMNQRRLESLYHFDNRKRLFQGVGTMVTFCLMTITGSPGPQDHTTDFVFFAHHPDELDAPERRFALGAEHIATLNPDTLTCPIFPTATDAAIALDVHQRLPILVKESSPAHNPWGLRFTTLFHMTNDSHHFKTAAELDKEGFVRRRSHYHHRDGRHFIPLLEAKMIHHFNPRHGDFDGATAKGHKLPEADPARLADPTYQPTGRYWVSQQSLQNALPNGWHRRWFIGWRDICRSTDERTVITSAVPPFAVANNLPVSQIERSELAACFVACASSMALDFMARFKVGGAHLNLFIAKQLPFVPPQRFDEPAPWQADQSLRQWITPRALELIYTCDTLSDFARDCGHQGPAHSWDIERRKALRAQLDAAFFKLFGLARPQVLRALDSFAVLKRKEMRLHGSFQSAEAIMNHFDRL